MRKGTELLRAILLIAIFTLVPVSLLQAAKINPANEYDSMYLYNALENKIQFRNFEPTVSLEESVPDGELESSFAHLMGEATLRQNFSMEQVSSAIKNLEDSSKIKSFIMSNDLGVLKFQLVQIKDATSQFTSLGKDFPTSENLIAVAKQIKISEGEQKKVEDLILGEEDKFSLFGWFVDFI